MSQILPERREEKISMELLVQNYSIVIQAMWVGQLAD